MIDLAAHDRRVRQSLLNLLVHTAPTHWSADELARYLTHTHDDLATAAADLAADGLIHRHDTFLFATRAAIAAKDLLE